MATSRNDITGDRIASKASEAFRTNYDAIFRKPAPMSKRVLKFSASWCGPCKALGKTIASIEDLPVVVEEIDIDEQSDVAIAFRVRTVPTCIVVVDSTEVRRKTGSMTKQEFLDFIAD